MENGGEPKAREQITKARAEIASDWERNQHGQIVADSQKNVLRALAEMEVTLQFNEFADRVEVKEPGRARRYLDDAAVNHLRFEIERRFEFRRPTKDFAFDYTEEIARETGSYHPVKDYFAVLKWDGTSRINTWLIKFMGVDTDDDDYREYIEAISRLTLIAAVRRIRQPGCKFDQILVLIQKQGIGKSTAIELLAVNDEWFSDSLSLDAREQEVIEKTSGKWMIELAELKGMNAKRVEHVKAFAARRTDRARPAYGRKNREAPRQFLLFGTTNETQFLTDDENRRFWPVVVRGEVDLDGLRRDRDQLWAEACEAESAGESIVLPRRLWPMASKVQRSHRTMDAWEVDIGEVLEETPTGKVRSDDLWIFLGVERSRKLHTHNARLGSVMTALGWKWDQLSWSGGKKACYWKGDDEERERKIEWDQAFAAFKYEDGIDSQMLPPRHPLDCQDGDPPF